MGGGASRGVLVLVLVVLFAPGCDSSATLFPQRRVFTQAAVVSAVPLRRAAGGWERVCVDDGGGVDGVEARAILMGTELKGSDDGELGIRPGDIVDMREVGGPGADAIDLASPGRLGLGVTCLDAVGDAAVDDEACAGTRPAVTLEGARWVARTADRGAGHDVLVILDQSGSMGGIVDAGAGFTEALPSGEFQIPGRPADVASDQLHARLAAVRALLGSLDPEDRFGLIAFSEGAGGGAGLSVPCAGAGSDALANLTKCFGRNRDLWLGDGGLASLEGEASGRSNLWRALEVAWDFMRDLGPAAGRSRDIIVVSDGPDTCTGPARNPVLAACTSIGAASVLERLAREADAAGVAVHVVQFEAVGYPGRDMDQVAAACLTGGHYRFVNSNDFVGESRSATLDAALERALLDIRHGLMGHWAIVAAAPAFASDDAAPLGAPPGDLYALTGELVVDRTSRLVTATMTARFGLGQGPGSDLAPAWDLRPTLAKP